jgi:hypothetical protein
MPDYNYYSIADQSNVEVNDFQNPDNPLIYDDVLKLSKATSVHIHDSTVQGGKEDCIDMNRNCEGITVTECRLNPNGQYGSTIKGGTKNVWFENVVFTSRAKTVEIDLGNWSDQDKKNKTTGITLKNVTHVDGNPVRVRVLWAARPNVIGGNVKVTVIPSWIVAILRFFRGLF